MIPYLLPVVRVLMIGAAVVAVLLARRVPSHRPVAVALVVQTGVMLARWALLELYPRGAVAARLPRRAHERARVQDLPEDHRGVQAHHGDEPGPLV